jgi:uncharacterized protein
VKNILSAILIRLIVYSALICLAISLAAFFQYAHPKRHVTPPDRLQDRLRPESVRLRTSDGVELDAWFIPNKKSPKAVIVCHGYPMDKGNVLGMAEFLAGDFNLLFFDFRAMGKSGGFFSTGGWRERKDVSAAVGILEAKGFPRAGAHGFSPGAAPPALAEDPEIRARVLDSPFANLYGELDYVFGSMGAVRHPLLRLMQMWNFLFLGINSGKVAPEDFIAGIKTPVLLIHGDGDTTIPAASSLKLHELNPGTELWLVKGADHGQAASRGGAEYKRRVLAFFNKNL